MRALKLLQCLASHFAKSEIRWRSCTCQKLFKTVIKSVGFICHQGCNRKYLLLKNEGCNTFLRGIDFLLLNCLK